MTILSNNLELASDKPSVRMDVQLNNGGTQHE